VFLFFYLEWTKHFQDAADYANWEIWFMWLAIIFMVAHFQYLIRSYNQWKTERFSLVGNIEPSEKAFERNSRLLWHPMAEVNTAHMQNWLDEMYSTMAEQVVGINGQNPHEFLEKHKDELGFHYCEIKTKLKNKKK